MRPYKRPQIGEGTFKNLNTYLRCFRNIISAALLVVLAMIICKQDNSLRGFFFLFFFFFRWWGEGVVGGIWGVEVDIETSKYYQSMTDKHYQEEVLAQLWQLLQGWSMDPV